MEPTFTLLYTSARPKLIPIVVEKWQNLAKWPERLNWSVTVDEDNYEAVEALQALKLNSRSAVSVVSDLPGTCVKGWNLAAEKIADRLGDVLIAVADDFEPPLYWDQALVELSQLPTELGRDPWWKRDAVVHVQDGYNTDIFTLSIFTKIRYYRYGYVFYPSYASIYCDTEFTAVAILDKVAIEAPHLVFEHKHPDCRKRVRDAVDLKHSSDSRYASGKQLYEYRKALGFPLDDGPKADYEPVEAHQLAVYIQATKDDFCLLEVCNRLYEEGMRVFFFYVPLEYWSGVEVPPHELDQVREIANTIGQLPDVTVVYSEFDITIHRRPGISRIDVETLSRNQALAWIRKAGYKHIVIVDGDELWRVGLLEKLLRIINDIQPFCVYTGMIPVIGLPGFPIEGAIDKATIYVGKDAKFEYCRGTFGPRYELEGAMILHFTATRKTMMEIIQKSRDSGHYDDPAYAFEDWIANTLPFIKPGMKNVHMYKPYNPWKLVRHWTKSEMEEIPETLHRYLSIVDSKISTSRTSPHVSGKFTADGWPKAN